MGLTETGWGWSHDQRFLSQCVALQQVSRVQLQVLTSSYQQSMYFRRIIMICMYQNIC
ncbi:unnamed protein product [Amoebophrya sp. A25]|nr:unnamed protein product [Amoebophrya sp. A25]|eukprot:GSA25T00011581001.1